MLGAELCGRVRQSQSCFARPDIRLLWHNLTHPQFRRRTQLVPSSSRTRGSLASRSERRDMSSGTAPFHEGASLATIPGVIATRATRLTCEAWLSRAVTLGSRFLAGCQVRELRGSRFAGVADRVLALSGQGTSSRPLQWPTQAWVFKPFQTTFTYRVACTYTSFPPQLVFVWLGVIQGQMAPCTMIRVWIQASSLRVLQVRMCLDQRAVGGAQPLSSKQRGFEHLSPLTWKIAPNTGSG